MTALREFHTDLLQVSIHRTNVAMGQSAAADIAEELRTRLESQEQVRVIFAAAPS